MGGKPSAPASSASRGEGFPLFTFSAVSRTIDSDCISNREEDYITTAFFKNNSLDKDLKQLDPLQMFHYSVIYVLPVTFFFFFFVESFEKRELDF